jgi:subfamily B ATP-binding cassette protein MsbA
LPIDQKGHATDHQRLQTIGSLLKPHSRALALGFTAAVGEGIANLLEPWPLKIVLDNLLRDKPAEGWLNSLLLSWEITNSPFLLFAAIAALLVGILGALCSYAEKYYTSTVGQWVLHDLRGTLYSRIQTPFAGLS